MRIYLEEESVMRLMKILYLAFISLLYLGCNENPDVSGTTVGTGNPQVSFEGTLVSFSKASIDSGTQIHFSLYKTDAKPWLDSSASVFASTEGALINLDSANWGLDLSTLTWQGEKDSVFLSNLFIAAGESQIQMIPQVYLDGNHFLINAEHQVIDSLPAQLETPQNWSGTVQYNSLVYNPPRLGFVGTPYVVSTDFYGEYTFQNLVSNLGQVSGVLTEKWPSDICTPTPGAPECPPPDTTQNIIEYLNLGEFVPGEEGNLFIDSMPIVDPEIYPPYPGDSTGSTGTAAIN